VCLKTTCHRPQGTTNQSNALSGHHPGCQGSSPTPGVLPRAVRSVEAMRGFVLESTTLLRRAGSVPASGVGKGLEAQSSGKLMSKIDYL